MRGRNQKTDAIMKAVAVILPALLLLVGLPSLTNAEQVKMEYSFERPLVRQIIIGNDSYHRVTMADAPNYGLTGQPALPARGTQILLPAGTSVADIEIVLGERILLGSDFLIEPTAQPVKLSADPSQFVPPTPDNTIYSSNRAFPEVRSVEIGTHGFRGYQMLILRLHPVEYIPVSGELYYYPRLTVLINTDDDLRAPLFRGLAKDELDVRTKVDNPDQADSYATFARSPESDFELLIITIPSLVDAFQPLMDYHNANGIVTQIHTTTDVGSNNPDDVRAYITERYLNDGIGYVLIGGDDDLIPAKNLYVDSRAGEIEYNMPGDIYLACLDGTYNYDGDSRWGEPEDGEGGGDVDLVAEVYVGRATVGNTTEADRFVSKTLQYLTSDDPYLQKVLMCGEYLGFGGVAEYAGNTMDQIVDGSDADGYTTVGIPRAQFEIDKLYDRNWGGNDWPMAELIGRVNDGLHIINHLGHGSPGYAMKMTSGDVLNYFTNDNHCFIISQTCLAGHFDGTDCWAENATIKTDHGAFAIVMNARFGWGVYGSTDGASQRFNREFWDAVFNPTEYTPQLGRANQDSKEDNLYRISQPCMRWCYYEINLFGDPTVSLNFDQASPELAFDYPNGVPDTVNPNQANSLEVTVSGYYGGIPVPGSGQLHYIINDGPVETVAMTEIAPAQYEVTLPNITCEDQLEFYLSAEEESAGTYYDPDPDDPYVPEIISNVISVLDDDFNQNLGWTVSGDATNGQWQRGIPIGHGDRGDPNNDFDGSRLCYLTGNADGESDVDNGTTYLDSPVFDLSAGDARIRYARWYCNDFGENPYEDVFEVYISNNAGADWTIAETVGPTDEASGDWLEYEFWAGDLVTPTDQMQLRFAASDLNGNSVVEAAIDAVTVTVYECENCACPTLGDWNGDGTINPVDVVLMVGYVYLGHGATPTAVPECPSGSGDWNCDNQCNPVDVVRIVNYVYLDITDGLCNPCLE